MKGDVGVPKAERVARTLEQDIREGRLPHGDQLESESTLMRRFSVSRNTVRKGLETLVRQGLITTRKGMGSFVTYGGELIDSSLGWTLALSQGSRNIETRMLGIRQGTCTIADDVLGTQQTYLCIDRLRYCNESNQGISLERSRLPWRDAYSVIMESGLEEDSLNQTLVNSGLITRSGEEWVGVIPSLPKVDALVMQRAAGQPMMRLRRITRAEDGSVIEFVESVLDPDRFGMHMEF